MDDCKRNEELQIECEICNKKFRTIVGKKKHITRMHNKPSSPTIDVHELDETIEEYLRNPPLELELEPPLELEPEKEPKSSIEHPLVNLSFRALLGVSNFIQTSYKTVENLVFTIQNQESIYKEEIRDALDEFDLLDSSTIISPSMKLIMHYGIDVSICKVATKKEIDEIDDDEIINETTPVETIDFSRSIQLSNSD